MSDTNNEIASKTFGSVAARRRFLQSLKTKGAATRMPYSSTANNVETDDAALLLLLHQSLQDINAGMARTNIALSELVEEVKLLRKSQ